MKVSPTSSNTTTPVKELKSDVAGISSADLIEINKLLDDQKKEFKKISRRTVGTIRKGHYLFQEEMEKKFEELMIKKESEYQAPSSEEPTKQRKEKEIKPSKNSNSFLGLFLTIIIGSILLFIVGHFFPSPESIRQS